MLKITVLVSGGGTNLQAIIDRIEDGTIENAKVVKIISSSPKAYALERAKNHGIDAAVVGKSTFPGEDNIQEKITQRLIQEVSDADTDLVVLAGYMSILSPEFIRKYKGRIINIHPSLIPKYCGKGFYGMRVHTAVIEAGEKESGATVHYVDEGVDTGEIILQGKVPVEDGDTPEDLAARVLKVEHTILPEVINRIARRYK